MVFLIIQTTNASFMSNDDGANYANIEQAKAAALKGSLQIVSDEIRDGKTSSSVEMILKDRDGRRHHHASVAISVSEMFLPENTQA